ncbi:MAG: hypothetical protein WCC12_20660 [Anaerolineales bacterium]
MSTSPAARRNAIRHDPSFLAITRWGRHHLTVAEYFRDGSRNPLDYVGVTLHHEIGHRIDAAISGDNYPDGRTRQHERFSQSAEFIASIDQDLRDAGWRPGQALPPGLRIHPSLLPELGSNGRVDWSRAAQEIFADLYAWRFSTTLNDQSGVIETHRTDFGIFRRTGRLVDRAVATFAGQPVVPVNTNSGDYRPGEQPRPLDTPGIAQRLGALLSGTIAFRPVPPDTPHPPSR